MLIDTLSIQYSGRADSVVVSDPTQQRLINEWANLLGSVGWTQTAAIEASASMTYPLGAPISGGVPGFPLTPVSCSPFPGFLSIGDQWFTLYDPFTESPTPGLCNFVEMDVTSAGTLANVVAAVNALTPWFAVLVHNGGASYTINFTSLAGGPEFNFVDFASAGFASGGDRSSGGGYEYESSGDSTSAVYRCSATNPNSGGAGINYLYGNIRFTFTINGQPISYQLLDSTQGTIGFLGSLGVGAVPEYTVIANPYGFAIFDFPRDTTTQLFRTISLFAMAPYFPTSSEVPPSEVFVPAYAVFVIGPNQIGGAPSWNNDHMQPSTMCLDGSLFQTSGFNASARLVAYRSPTFPLLSPMGQMFHYCAYVQFGSDPLNTDPAWVVGKLWDVCLSTDLIASDAIIDGRQFLTMGYSDGSAGQTVCTVLMAAGAPAGTTRTGTVNLFGDGVTWISGQKFTADMVGAPITIGGTSYIVKSFTDDTHITLTTALTIGSGLTYVATDPTVVETGGQSPLCIAAPGGSGGASVFSNSGH